MLREERQAQKKNNTLRVRLTDYEVTKLRNHAEKHGVSVSHIIHEYIKRLPAPRASGFEGYEYTGLENF